MRILVLGSKELAENLESVLSHLNVQIKNVAKETEAQEEFAYRNFDAVCFDDDYYAQSDKKTAEKILAGAKHFKVPFIVISSDKDLSRIIEMRENGARDYILKPYNDREFNMRFSAVAYGKTRLACIGGGSGLFTLLVGIKAIPQTLLTSIVSMSDDGGSSGKLTQSLGVLPPGDVRRSLVALSNAPEIMNQILQYRFEKKGELEGHSFGNIFLAALAGVKGSMPEAVRALGDILYIQGIVLPVSRTLVKLSARFEDGTVVKGESNIDRCDDRAHELKLKELWHEPDADADGNALSAIIFSDYVTIGPGDLFTSIITNIVVKNIREALIQTKAKKIYICNLMTKPGETSQLDAADHVNEILKYLGGDFLDFILVSDTKFAEEAIADYAKKNQAPVILEDPRKIRKMTRAKLIMADVANSAELVRHDSHKLKQEIQRIIGVSG